MQQLVSEDQAIESLLQGGVGVLRTDTIYGVVARAADEAAVARLYDLKHREHKPGTIIAASVQQLIDLGVEERYLSQAAPWWPNSLSVETPLGPNLAYLHQGMGRQGLRVVADERVRHILEKTGPLATSSANQPGQAPSTIIEDAINYFGDQVDFYLDGGDCSNQPPSTIAKVTDAGMEIIRQGAVIIPPEALAHPECPFCLHNNKLEAPILYENADAYLTPNRDTQGNFLIIPKGHAEQLTELPDTWWFTVKDILAHATLPESYNLSLNYGQAAGQSVKHLHFWIVRRETGQPGSNKGLVGLLHLANQESDAV